MTSIIFQVSAHKCGWPREPKACQPDYNWCIWYQIQDTWYLILMVFDRIKVREFNLPRHRKLNLINHQRFRLPDDQFDSDRWDLLSSSWWSYYHAFVCDTWFENDTYMYIYLQRREKAPIVSIYWCYFFPVIAISWAKHIKKRLSHIDAFCSA